MTPTISDRVASWETNPQRESVLYNGTIPTEIRLIIFRHAMEEFTIRDHRIPSWVADHDFRIRDDHNGENDQDLSELAPSNKVARSNAEAVYIHSRSSLDWVRPGYTGRKMVTVALLRTCRLIFMETRDLPMQTKEMCAWLWNGPQPAHHMESIFKHLLTRYQLNQLRSLHLFMYMHYLEASLYMTASDSRRIFRRIENLRITIRKGDWQIHPDEPRLFLYPFDGGIRTDMVNRMYEAMEDMEDYKPNTDGAPPMETSRNGVKQPGWMPPVGFSMKWKFQRPWGLTFGHLPNLKTLTMDFDIDETRKDELDRIVEWAHRVWRFPLNPQLHGYHYLSADGNPIERMSWRGTPNLWDHHCRTPQCRGQWLKLFIKDWELDQDRCEECKRKRRLVLQGLGPRMYTWTVTWTARRFHGKSFYDYYPMVRLQKVDDMSTWGEDVGDPSIELYNTWLSSLEE